MKIASYRRRSILHHFPVEEVFAVVAVSGLVNYVNPFLKVGTVELVANLFKECEDGDFHGLCKADSFSGVIVLLLIAAVIKIGLTLVTFGVKVPAGIFMPSMAVGACVGRTLGMVVQAWQRSYPGLWLFGKCAPDTQCVTPGTYAMVGAAATLGGVTRMTGGYAKIIDRDNMGPRFGKSLL